ncbi:Outer membrane protein Omp28 [Aequorivita sublithincola DSM 14238]|uniref:Outer membrane protein Omp28 n=1 Tax=Aequorivita sublithincola (strain DSM 14238 / LMG 21431 / ACAM 643 / 9-3) TaxID=746697 RepID=I3YSQ4_AEQSU|nr:Omp28-related outer membrane protein [Aequorivita sublithincola]AFL80022.1 Outer membrane protein Omp28 [Aequorivita sublithincola DSM 14238]
MRTYPYFKILFLFAFIAIVGCSKKEDPLGAPTETLAITLASDAGTNATEVLSVNEQVNFIISGSDGADYTSNAKLYVNDAEILGSSYTFSEVGTFVVKAIYGTATSNVLNFEVIAESQRALTIDVTRAMNNQTITFGLLDSDGNNTAADATFYVNGAPISGFTYSSSTEAAFEVYAEYIVNGETLTTSLKNFTVYIPKRNVVLEDYTGVWCGFCLKALVAMDSIQSLTDHVSVLAIHESGSVVDIMNFSQVNDLQARFNVPDAFPQTELNRTTPWNSPTLIYDYDLVTSMAGLETDLSIAINSRVVGSTLTVDAKVVYKNGSETGDKLVVYLLESGIIQDQANYFTKNPKSPYFGKGDPIKDFVHNDALRNSLSGLFGDNIPQTTAYEEYKKTYTFAIPAEYNAANLSFVVMVVKADDTAKNSQHAVIGENKTYY